FHCHGFLLLWNEPTVGSDGRTRIARIHQKCDPTAWSFLTRRESQTSSCSNAYAPAAVREATPSFVKMFCTWRATVCSLITRDPAISLLLLPVATRRRTSTSRDVSPCAAG